MGKGVITQIDELTALNPSVDGRTFLEGYEHTWDMCQGKVVLAKQG